MAAVAERVTPSRKENNHADTLSGRRAVGRLGSGQTGLSVVNAKLQARGWRRRAHLDKAGRCLIEGPHRRGPASGKRAVNVLRLNRIDRLTLRR